MATELGFICFFLWNWKKKTIWLPKETICWPTEQNTAISTISNPSPQNTARKPIPTANKLFIDGSFQFADEWWKFVANRRRGQQKKTQDEHKSSKIPADSISFGLVCRWTHRLQLAFDGWRWWVDKNWWFPVLCCLTETNQSDPIRLGRNEFENGLI